MSDTGQRDATVRSIRVWLALFMAGLVLSGVTAFPLLTELRWLDGFCRDSAMPAGFAAWISRVRLGLEETNARHPFIAYGTDWLAFAHLMIAVAFIGPWRDPVRNRWIIDWGLICCVAVIPLALIAGAYRGLPLGWRLIDCSFGVFGAIPLLIVRRLFGKGMKKMSESYAA